MCVEEGRVRVDVNQARDRLQTKTKHGNMILTYNLYYHKLSFRIKQGFCVLLDNS